MTCCSLAAAGQRTCCSTPARQSRTARSARCSPPRSSPTAAARPTRCTSTSPAFEILAAVGTTFEQECKQYCPDCGYGKIDIPLTSLGKDAPDRIVSYLRSHPNVELHRPVGERLARPGPPRRAAGRRPRRQGQDRRPGRQPAGLPGRRLRQDRRRHAVVALRLRLLDARRPRPQVGRRPGRADAAGVLADDEGQHAVGTSTARRSRSSRTTRPSGPSSGASPPEPRPVAGGSDRRRPHRGRRRSFAAC